MSSLEHGAFPQEEIAKLTHITGMLENENTVKHAHLLRKAGV